MRAIGSSWSLEHHYPYMGYLKRPSPTPRVTCPTWEMFPCLLVYPSFAMTFRKCVRLPGKESCRSLDKTLSSKGVSCPALHQAKPFRKLNTDSIHVEVGHLADLQQFIFLPGSRQGLATDGGWSSSAPTEVSDPRKREAA